MKHPQSRWLARLTRLLFTSLVVLALAAPAVQASPLMRGASGTAAHRMSVRAGLPPGGRPEGRQMGREPATPIRVATSASISGASIVLIVVGTAGAVGALVIAGLLLMSRDTWDRDCPASRAGC